MDKFLEELEPGSFFEFDNKRFLLTSDFKKNGDKFCIDIDNGQARWIKPDAHIHYINLYAMDINNNFNPIKEIKSDVSSQIKGIL